MNCKLIGQFIQHLEIVLEPGEEFFVEKGSVIYLQSGIEKELALNGSGLGRLIGAKLSGESLFIIRLYNPTRRQLKAVLGGKFGLLPVKLNGESMICHRGVYVGSNHRVDISTKLSLSGLTGGMGMLLQKIEGSATVFLDTKGAPIVAELQCGDSIEVDEDHIIAIKNIPGSRIRSNWSLGNLLSGEGLSMMSITGPGTVYLSPSSINPPYPQ